MIGLPCGKEAMTIC